MALTMLMIIILSFSIFSLADTKADIEVSEAFHNWTVMHNKVYVNDSEKSDRFRIFKSRWDYVESFKKLPSKSYTVGLNFFSDLTTGEILESYTCGGSDWAPSRSRSTSSLSPHMGIDDVDYTTDDDCGAIDWVAKGYVSRPGLQSLAGLKKCGSCWAFAAVAGVEGIVHITRQSLNVPPLSVQQLVDCDTGNDGCAGGYIEDAYEYIIKNKGLTTADNYPYIFKDGQCDVGKEKQIAVSIDAYESVPPYDEPSLIKAVCRQPVTVGIMMPKELFAYTGGVFSGNCITKKLNHAVTIVGMGTTVDGIKYWTLKNSWGENWGEQGYFRILRGTGRPEGHCAVNLGASYPVIYPRT